MRNLLLLAGFLLAIPVCVMATDRFVDNTLSSGNGTTTFNSIASAVAASDINDRIIIAPGTYSEPQLLLPHALTLMPSEDAGIVELNANVVFTPGDNYRYEVFNLELGQYSYSYGASGNQSARTVVHFIDCQAENWNFDADGWDIIVISCVANEDIIYRHGDIIRCDVGDEILMNNEAGSAPFDRIQSVIQCDAWAIYLRSTHAQYRVANNYLLYLYVTAWNTDASITNDFINNRFKTTARVYFAFQSVPRYNIRFINNTFNANLHFCNGTSGTQGDFGGGGTPGNCTNTSFGLDCNKPGYLEWSYNDLPGFFSCTPNASQPLVLNHVFGSEVPADAVNGGKPTHEFYDTDLTINDRGRDGGTWGSANFPAELDGKAYIYTLDMPADLFPSVPVNVSARSYQRH